MKLTDLKVSTRLAGGFAIVCFGAALLAAGGWFGIHHQSQIAQHVIDRDVAFTRSIASIRARVQMLRRYEKDMLLNVLHVDKLKEYRAKWHESRKRLDELMVAARQNAVTDEERKRLDQLGAALVKYGAGME